MANNMSQIEGYEDFLREIKERVRGAQIRASLSVNRELVLLYWQEVQEREVEKQLVEHITKFLLELGVGFAFVGKQYPLKVGAEDFYIDLLFYHVKLHCYVVIELKTGKFLPEYAGKINFYLSAVDDLLKSSVDNPSIGLILCATKDNVIAEYALRDVNKPIGIAGWQTQLTKSLPKELQTNLPTIEQLEAELDSVSMEIED